jgi:hypothetical protein
MKYNGKFDRYITEMMTLIDPDLEAKLFPHLFPFGKGSCEKWHQMYSGKQFRDSFSRYVCSRLLSVDRRWAKDP